VPIGEIQNEISDGIRQNAYLDKTQNDRFAGAICEAEMPDENDWADIPSGSCGANILNHKIRRNRILGGNRCRCHTQGNYSCHRLGGANLTTMP